jgi:hypothetical protein
MPYRHLTSDYSVDTRPAGTEVVHPGHHFYDMETLETSLFQKANGSQHIIFVIPYHGRDYKIWQGGEGKVLCARFDASRFFLVVS